MAAILSWYSCLFLFAYGLLQPTEVSGQFTEQPPYEIVSVNVSEPTSNSPLDTTLAYYRLKGYNGLSDTLTHGYFTVPCGANISVHYTDPDVFLDAGTADRPILLLNHGYPETSYIWRNVSPDISKRVPVVIPDVSPGSCRTSW
jgi:hypothetical protein